MPTKRPTGKAIDVDRVVSVGRDRETGGAAIRLSAVSCVLPCAP